MKEIPQSMDIKTLPCVEQDAYSSECVHENLCFSDVPGTIADLSSSAPALHIIRSNISWTWEVDGLVMQPILAPRRCFPFHSVCACAAAGVPTTLKFQVSPLFSCHHAHITMLTSLSSPPSWSLQSLRPTHFTLHVSTWNRNFKYGVIPGIFD